MFREMRRIKQQLSEDATIKVLERGTNGILSVIGDDGYPYGVPLSYVYNKGKIYLHCAKKGHKLDAMAKNNKVCFTVVDKDEVVGQALTSYFRSVIVFGTARVLEDPEEKLQSHLILSNKYSGEFQEEIQKEIKRAYDHMLMIEIDIKHMTGKEAIELVENGSSLLGNNNQTE